MRRIVIQHGRLVDPSQGLDRVGSLLIEGEQIVGIDVDDPSAEPLDASGCIVSPGWIDIAVELREPGFEEDETIRTGTAAALAGGFTTIVSLPNTEPPIDSPASVEYVQQQARRAGHCHVLVLACLSKQRLGQQLAELGLLDQSGAVGFTDAPFSLANTELMRRALQYCRMFGKPIFNHPDVVELRQDAVMHEGLVSTVLGLKSIPAAAEDVMVGRDLRLAEATGGDLHLLHISTRGSVEQIRRAKERGVPVTCSVALPNLIETDEAMRSFNTGYKLNPPLRSSHHVEACLQGLRDETIDVISSGHAPRAPEKKLCELDVAPFGTVGLETAVPLIVTRLVESGQLSWTHIVQKLSTNPAKLLKQNNKGALIPGFQADLTLIDPTRTWSVPARGFWSKGAANPWVRGPLRGSVRYTIVNGEVRYAFDART